MRGELLERDRAHSIVGAFYDVYNYYGYGLSESVYAGALEMELKDRGHTILRELAVPVLFKGRQVALQRLDIVVDQRIVVELKATEKLSSAAHAQVLSYLRATWFEVGLLLHFGPQPRFHRFIDFPKRLRGLTRVDSSNSSDSSDSCPVVEPRIDPIDPPSPNAPPAAW